VKLTILGGGGVRMPGFVRAVLRTRPGSFDQICLLEPDQLRRDTIGTLAAELASTLGQPGLVAVTADPAEALTGADFVFSAIRVGGDRARVIDEQVALRRGLVGQETTGPGGFAMALRTIPVVLSYCELLRRYAPGATLINFTNPVGLITQAIAGHGGVRVVGVCDTPGGTIEHLREFLGADRVEAGYAGLNHLGWVTSLRVDADERIGELLARFEELQQAEHRFAAFDPAMIRRVGALPTEYVYYFYDPQRYVREVAAAGSSRGEDVLRLNTELLDGLAKAFANCDVRDAWAMYSRLLGVRRDTYMRTDMEGASGQEEARARRAARPEPGPGAGAIGGYEGLALRVIDGLTGAAPSDCIVNVPGAGAVAGLNGDDVVETWASVSPAGIVPRPSPALPRSAQGLVLQVKEYERAAVDAAVGGDFGLAAVALAMHPLVPGITAARELLTEYRELHGPLLDYLT
jgi:alpha-galactosidase/6-phospho-beta-glucosidase family protein